jgi:hypothetical protein
VVAAGVVVLTGGLTACGSDKGDGGRVALAPIDALMLASKQTNEQHSAKVDGTTKIGAASSEMTGEMDWRDGMRANMTITQRGGAVENSPLAGKPMQARYTPDAMFVNLGDEFAAAPGSGGAHWMQYDYATLAEKAGPSGAFLKDQMQNTDPARSVQLLIASGKVNKVGEESVRGTGATRYTGTVDVSELARMQSKDLSEKDLKGLQDQLEAAGMETETIDLWVDGDNLLVKKRERASSDQGAYDSTVFYSGYGVDVTVEEPPASDTMNFEDALKQQQG